MSNDLVEDLSIEERKKMEIWAEATRELASDKTEMSMELILKVIQSNTSIPAILVDENGEINQYLNLSLPEADTEGYLKKKLVGRLTPPIPLSGEPSRKDSLPVLIPALSVRQMSNRKICKHLPSMNFGKIFLITLLFNW